MQSDILKKIDVLVNMAGSSLNIDTLHAELKEIEKESARLKKELSYLTSGNLEEKYFKASEKQVDENIKVSLEAKIRKQEKSISELQEQISLVSLDEENYHNSIALLNEEIATNYSYVKSLEERLETVISSDSLENYKNILKDEKKHGKELASLLKQKEEDYSSVLEKLNYLNLAKEEMNTKLNNDKETLADIKSNLINPSSYVDEEMKKIDDARIEEIKKQLLDLDKRRIEIITDPAMIAEEAKELIIDDDRTSALSKVRELVTIVKSKPFMDINGTELASILQEELENASNIRDEFAALIDTKDYSGENNSVISERINYLNIEIANLEDKIRLLNEEVKRIDNADFNVLTERLDETIKISLELEQSIQEYEEIINNDEEKTPKRRAVLVAAFEKKKKDLENILLIIESYKKDQRELIKRAYNIESVEITNYEQKISKIQEEINKLNKLLLNSNTAKDVLAIENDKKKLKELDDQVKAIKHRQKYSETPNELFDEIEIFLGTIDDEEEVNFIEDKNEDAIMEFDLDDDFVKEIDLNEESLLDEVSEIEDIPFNSEPVINVEPIESEVVLGELPEIEDVIEEAERLKVINVEPVEEVEKNTQEENPFIIGDYRDDDYMNVSSLFDSEGGF